MMERKKERRKGIYKKYIFFLCVVGFWGWVVIVVWIFLFCRCVYVSYILNLGVGLFFYFLVGWLVGWVGFDMLWNRWICVGCEVDWCCYLCGLREIEKVCLKYDFELVCVFLDMVFGFVVFFLCGVESFFFLKVYGDVWFVV